MHKIKKLNFDLNVWRVLVKQKLCLLVCVFFYLFMNEFRVYYIKRWAKLK